MTPHYAVTGWRKAFRIVDGKYLKTRLKTNVRKLWQLGKQLLLKHFCIHTLVIEKM
jgi:hypothetical protein